MSRWLSFALLLGIIVAVSIVFYRVMIGFLLPLFLAAILVIVFRPLHERCRRRWPGWERLAASLTVGAVILLVIVPTALVTTLAAVEASSLATNLGGRTLRDRLNVLRGKLDLHYEFVDEMRYLESSLETLHEDAEHGATAHGEPAAYQRLIDAVNQLDGRLTPAQRGLSEWTAVGREFAELKRLGDDAQRLGTLPYQTRLRQTARALRSFKLRLLGGEVRAWLKEIANPSSDELASLTGRFFAGAPGFLQAVGGATTGFLANLAMQSTIMVLAMYFFLIDGEVMVETAMRLSPLDNAYERELIEEFGRISRAVVLATLLSAVVQGLLAGVGLWVAGVGSVFLLSTITIVFALVPFVGAACVWLPACFWLYLSEGRPWAAIALGLYGALVVSTSDNLIKPLVLHGQSNLHPLLALLSVLGGVNALGPIGILVGPMVVVFLQTLLNMLHRELTGLDKKAGVKLPIDAAPTSIVAQ